MFFKNLNDTEFAFNPRNSYLQGQDAAFGCSMTYGLGVDENQAWPSLVGVYNLGQPGSSNDRIVRLAIEYINDYRPNNIFVMWTFPERREWIDKKGTPIRFVPSSERHKNTIWHRAHTLLDSEENDKYNYNKNKLLLQTYCSLHCVNLHQTYVYNHNMHVYPLGKDNAHPGPLWHKEVAEYFNGTS
jgi:hypothetical protein